MNRPDQTSFCCSGGWEKLLFSNRLNFHLENERVRKIFLLEMNKNTEKKGGKEK